MLRLEAGRSIRGMSGRRGEHPSSEWLSKRRYPMNWSTLLVRLVVLLLAPAALLTSSADGFPKAKAMISGGANGISGTALLVEDGNGNVVVTVVVKGPPSVLTAGRHGVHIHEIG